MKKNKTRSWEMAMLGVMLVELEGKMGMDIITFYYFEIMKNEENLLY